MRIPKLLLIVEIDDELTEIFKFKGKAPKSQCKDESYFYCSKVNNAHCTVEILDDNLCL